MLLGALALSATLASTSCWDIYDAALYRSAHTRHARLISYDESFALREGDTQLTEREQHMTYDDSTLDPEPGPPELGPYGKARNKWLGAPEQLATIAHLRVSGDITCTNEGRERYDGHDVDHISFHARGPNLPEMRDLWVDTRTKDVWKLTGYGTIFFNDGRRIAEFQVELGYVGPYLLVNRVVWASGLYTGEYRMRNFAFPLEEAMGRSNPIGPERFP